MTSKILGSRSAIEESCWPAFNVHHDMLLVRRCASSKDRMGWDGIGWDRKSSVRAPASRGDATRRGGAKALDLAAHPQDDISTIEGWLRSIALQDYAAAIKKYG